MPVFDFSSIPENEKKQDPVCTYTMFRSNEAAASSGSTMLSVSSAIRTNARISNSGKRAAVPMPIFYRSMQDS